VTQPAEFEPALERERELPEPIFSRIDDLIGQERALLHVPDRERTREQRDRLQRSAWSSIACSSGARASRGRRELTRRGLRSLIADLAHGP
jgi:hypothetical protein